MSGELEAVPSTATATGHRGLGGSGCLYVVRLQVPLMHCLISSLVGLITVVVFRLVTGFSGEVKPPPATLSMVAGGGGLVYYVLILFGIGIT